MPDLCTVALVKQLTGTWGDQDDTKLARLITAASVAIERRARRQLGPVASATYTFPVDERLYVDLEPREIRTVTSIKLNPGDADEVTLTTSDYDFEPIGGALGSDGAATYFSLLLASDVTIGSDRLTRFGRSKLQIAGAWGLATTPDDVAQAAALTVASWADRAVDAYDLQQTEDSGPVAAVNVARGYSIPNGAMKLLRPYIRVRV